MGPCATTKTTHYLGKHVMGCLGVEGGEAVHLKGGAALRLVGVLIWMDRLVSQQNDQVRFQDRTPIIT